MQEDLKMLSKIWVFERITNEVVEQRPGAFWANIPLEANKRV
jgi:hypothetical protein